MRTKYIAGNWKMNMDKQSALSLVKELVVNLKGSERKFMVAVPFVYLDAVGDVLKDSNIILGCQNMAATDNGAHTGEISASMLKDVGCKAVIIGHSERRCEFNESDELINKKVLKALENNLEVVLCIGELLSQREEGKAESVCEQQLCSALKGVSAQQMKSITIAYEPVWAIGTGKTATPDDAQKIHEYCRSVLARLYNDDVAQNTIIQYGGSMNASNAKDLLAMPDIDGGLIGGASLKADTFTSVCLA